LKSIDYIIVGQGIAGTILAHDLMERNFSVLVIDKALSASASKVAAGLFNPVSMKRCIHSWNASQFLPLAIQRYQELEQKLQTSFLHLKPLLKVFSNDQVCSDWKIKYSNTDIDQFISGFNEPNCFDFLQDLSGSAVISPAGSLDMNSFLSASRSFFNQKNSLLNELFDFNEFDSDLGRYKNFKANYILFCEGFRVLDNPYFNWLPLTPTKGEVMEIRIDKMEKMDWILSNGIYVLPKGDHRYIVGSTYNHKDIDDLVSQRGQTFLKTQLDSLLGLNYEVISSKAGVRPTVKDRKPLVGMHPVKTKLGVFNGLGTRGVLQAPGLSAQFCDKLTNHHKNTLSSDNERFKSYFKPKNSFN
jgi:glycine/D-amino acid oxidase-like deaminating enzyme